jgi:hypothetical protein
MGVNLELPVRVEVTNTSGDTLTAVAAELVALPRLQTGEGKALGAIPAGEARGVTLHCRTSEIFAKNGGYQMIAVKVTCAQTDPRDASITFKYLPVKTEAEINSPTATATPR